MGGEKSLYDSVYFITKKITFKIGIGGRKSTRSASVATRNHHVMSVYFILESYQRANYFLSKQIGIYFGQDSIESFIVSGYFRSTETHERQVSSFLLLLILEIALLLQHFHLPSLQTLPYTHQFMACSLTNCYYFNIYMFINKTC